MVFVLRNGRVMQPYRIMPYPIKNTNLCAHLIDSTKGSINREYYNLATTNAESWKDSLPFKMEAYAKGQTPGTSTPKKTTRAYAMLNYNARGLTTSILYTAPSGVETTPNVSFSYDANGNRETMTDGAGSVTYLYDTLSRMFSETRTFTGLSGSFPLSYEYHKETGQLDQAWS